MKKKIFSNEGLERIRKKKLSVNNLKNPKMEKKFKDKEYFKKKDKIYKLSKQLSLRLSGSNSGGNIFLNSKEKKLYSLISKFHLSKKFISTLRKIIGFRKVTLLRMYHFNQINDIVYFPNLISKFFILEYLKNLQSKKIFKKIIIFDPSKKIRILWDVIMLILITFQFFIIPIDLTFEISIVSNYYPFMLHFFRITFLLDFFINLNTGIFLKGKLNFERNLIFKNYLKNGLLSDLMSIFIVSNIFPRSILDLIFFTKLINFKKTLRKIQKYILADEIIINLMNLLTHVFNVLLLAHIFACIWFCIGSQNSNNWIQKNKLETKIWYEQYLFAYYFVVITMNTVGYGY